MANARLTAIEIERFKSYRSGGTLSDTNHRLLTLWAAACAEHVLLFLEEAQPDDERPRQVIELMPV